MATSGSKWVRVAGICGALAVLAGAFGAHGLRGRVSVELLEAYRTGALYHLVHSVVLLALACYGLSSGVGVNRVARLLVGGMLLFSGSLYLMAVTGFRWLGAVTPIGGLLLVAAWFDIAWGVARGVRSSEPGP